MTAHQTSLFPTQDVPCLPEGFRYAPDAITPDDETRLLSSIAGLPFKEFQFHGFEGKRRVVPFGWRYYFSVHCLEDSTRTPARRRNDGTQPGT
jgi:hypothetical protein